jgi:uncharacterized protein (DUF2164 family)
MKEIKRGLDILSEEDRDKFIKKIISYFHDERNEEIGVVAAGNILDFFIENAGKEIYNKAIEDSKEQLKKQLDGWDVEFDLLKRQD